MWEIQSPADLAFPSTGRRGGGGGQKGAARCILPGEEGSAWRRAPWGDGEP